VLPWLLAAGGVGLLALAWWGLRQRASQPRQAAVSDAPWGEVATGMGPVEAFARGAALADSGLASASLPYLHHAVTAPGAPWHAWRAYASALHNVAMTGAADPLTAAAPAPRSSFERAALMRQALARIDRAIALTNSPPERAISQLTRAQFLRTWGFSWDALEDFHMAGELDPAWRDQGVFYAMRMRDPLRPDPGP
jgi:hypothetical protein